MDGGIPGQRDSLLTFTLNITLSVCMVSLRKISLSRRTVMASFLIVALSMLLPALHGHAGSPDGEHSAMHSSDHGPGADARAQDDDSKNNTGYCCHGALSGCSGVSFVVSELGFHLAYRDAGRTVAAVVHLAAQSIPPQDRPPRLPS